MSNGTMANFNVPPFVGTCNELERKVTVAGFEVLQSSYFKSFIYVPILIVRVWMERFSFIKK